MAAIGLHTAPSPATLFSNCSRQCATLERTWRLVNGCSGLGRDTGRLAQVFNLSSREVRRRPEIRFRHRLPAVSASLPESSNRNEQLKDASKGGDLSLVQSLLTAKDVQVNLASEVRAGWTALHLASFYEHPEVVEALLKAGASTEIRNESGNTALQLACLRGNLPIAKLLLDYGADIRAESNDRGTVMDYAVEWGGEEMVEFLYSWASVHNGE